MKRKISDCCAAAAMVLLFLSLLSVQSRAQKTISSDELLLDPTDLPTFERQINLIWKPVRDKIATLDDPNLAGRPQAALVNIYVKNNSWQLAWEYAQNIRVPIWRAQALLLIAKHQRDRDIQSLATRMLNSAVFLLKPVGNVNDAPEIFANTALSIIATQDFDLLQDFFESISGERNIIAMSQAAYPILPAEHRPIVLKVIQNLSEKFEGQYTQESFRFFLDLVDLGKELGIDEMHRGAIANAYNVSLRRDRDDKLRDNQLEQLANNLIFIGQHRLALQVIAKILDRTIQSKLYATAGRVRAELRKTPEAGRALLSLSLDSLLLIDNNNLTNQSQPVDKEKLQKNIENARSWNMIEKVQAGLKDEALRDAENIPDDYARQRAIALIALVLADNEKYDEIQSLIKELNYANLLLSLYIGLSNSFDNGDDVTNILLQSLESDTFHESRIGYPPRGIANVLEIQIARGNPKRHDEIFNSVQKTIRTYLQGFEKILAEIEYLFYYSKRSEVKAREADEQIKVILSAIWPYTEHHEYGYAMSRIMRFYLDAGKLEQAFNIVATLSEKKDAIKLRILADIAEVASRDGDEALTLRIINQIEDLPQQVQILTDSINNLAKSREIERF